jgi:hypothetical protein
MRIIEATFPEVEQVNVGDRGTVLTYLHTTEELSEASELFSVSHECVRTVELNQLLERFAMTLSAILTR